MPSEHVKLLGVALDRHFTFGHHIDEIVRNCSGILGTLSRAAPRLPRELLRLTYISLIRSHLEFASATFGSASKTQLKKLDTVQRKAARIICRAPRDCHSAPLLELLGLESLEIRRSNHIVKLVDSSLIQAAPGVVLSDNPLALGI